MKSLSIAAICMSAVTFYVGFYHLYLYYKRKRRHHEDLTFALTCFSMALYDLFSFGEYNATTLAEGFEWQRRQVAGLSLVGATYLSFMMDYTGRGSKRIRNSLIVYFIVSSIIVLFVKHPFVWQIDRPAIKEMNTIFGLHLRYLEVQPGLYTELLGFFGFVVFLYIFGISIQLYREGLREKARPIFLTTAIF